jgi:hypothetical protein
VVKKQKRRSLPRSRRRLWQTVAISIEVAGLVILVAIWAGLPTSPPELWQRICHVWQLIRGQL